MEYKTKFNKLQYKLMLLKRYFDYGFGMTNYFKYFVYLFAANELISSNNIKFSIALVVIWGVVSFILGYVLWHYGWLAADSEVSNRFNPFVRGVREKLK